MMQLTNNNNEAELGENPPMILNLDQKAPYSGEYLFGAIDTDRTKWNPGESGDIRKDFYWYPRGVDQKNPERRNEIQHNNVAKDKIWDFSEGEIHRDRAVKVILPDTFELLPEPLKTNADPGQTSLGYILESIAFSRQTYIDLLEEVADQEPEMIDKIKDIAIKSELDEEKLEEIKRVTNSLKDDSSSSSIDDS